MDIIKVKIGNVEILRLLKIKVTNALYYVFLITFILLPNLKTIQNSLIGKRF